MKNNSQPKEVARQSMHEIATEARFELERFWSDHLQSGDARFKRNQSALLECRVLCVKAFLDASMEAAMANRIGDARAWAQEHAHESHMATMLIADLDRKDLF